MSRWQGVEECVAVAQSASFTLAARHLGISTAQVSRQISMLEKRLGVQLFYRTTRKVTLTEAGLLYFQHCQQLLDGLDEAEQMVGKLHQAPRGVLKMTAPVTYGEQVLAPLLHQCMGEYSDIELHLRLTNQPLDLLAEGIDLAIRMGQLADSSFMARRLGSRQLHLVASPDYLKRQGMPHTLSELQGHHCLQGSRDSWRFVDKGHPISLRIQGRIRCNSGIALLNAVEQGLGIAQLPDYYVNRALAKGHLITLLEHYRSADDGIWALYPPNRQLSAKVRVVLDYLAQELATEYRLVSHQYGES